MNMFILFLFCKSCSFISRLFFFFFNDTATTEIYTLSLHDALPISIQYGRGSQSMSTWQIDRSGSASMRSEEHTSELQSHNELVFRLSLAKKKTISSTARHLSIARSYCRE